MVRTNSSQHGATIRLSLVFLFTLLLSNPTFAQDQPLPLVHMAYTALDELKLYIHGGVLPDQLTPGNQFAVLDLSFQSWDVSNPPWEIIPDTGSPSARGHSLVISSRPRHNILTLLTAGIIYSYDAQNNKWGVVGNQIFVDETGTKSVGDPKTNLIYTPANNEEREVMGRYQPIDNTRNGVWMYPGTEGIRGYSATWAGEYLFLYGGHVGATPWTSMLYFDRQALHPLPTTGKGPGALKNACMVPASSETKLVLFGGHSLDGKAAMAGIFIFDIKTKRWQKGTDAGRSQARFGMACAAAGDSFVVFGGQSVDRSPNFKPMIIYNFKTKLWGDHFYLDTPPPPPKTTTTEAPPPASSTTNVPKSTTNTHPTTTTDPEPPATDSPLPVSTPTTPPEPEEKTNAAVIGGAAGAAALVSFMLFFIYRRYKKRDEYHGDQYPQDAYQDKDYWGAERIHSRESFEDQQDGSQHAHIPLEAVGHGAGDNMIPYGYNSPASPPHLQQPSAVYSHASPTYFLSPCSSTSQSPYSDPALTTDFSAVKPLPDVPAYPHNMYPSNEPPQSQVSGSPQEIWKHQQGLYYGVPYQPQAFNMHQGPVEDGQFQQDAYGQPFISPPNVMPQNQPHEPMPLLVQAPRLSYDSQNGYNYGHNDQIQHGYAQNGHQQEYQH